MEVLTARALREGTSVFKGSYAGKVREGRKGASIVEDIRALGYRLVAIDRGQLTSDYLYDSLLVSNSGMVRAEDHDGSNVCVTWVVEGEDREHQLRSLVESSLQREDQKRDRSGRAYLLTTTQHGMDIAYAGKVGVAFDAENYTKDVRDAFAFLAEDLGSPSPSGRFALLDGPPGTGKTYFIRGLIQTISTAAFIFVPASIAGSLDSPQLTASLLKFRDRNQIGTMILVVEDADDLIIPRGMDNMGHISTLLNVTDGVLGELFDIRVLATTNAKRLDVDSALTRRGRLSAAVTVKKLEPEHAELVYRRLVDDEHAKFGWTVSVPLADVYYAAKQHGWNEGDDVETDREATVADMNREAMERITRGIGF
jgi:SpoVK/Ycf46/Vps4 family AAA+-type ATPase